MARLTPITKKDQVPAKHHAIVDNIVKSRELGLKSVRRRPALARWLHRHRPR